MEIEGRTVIPGCVTREWVESRKREWGEDSPLFEGRVLGRFPTESDDTLIQLGWIENAFTCDLNPDGPIVLCCDVVGTAVMKRSLVSGRVTSMRNLNGSAASH